MQSRRFLDATLLNCNPFFFKELARATNTIGQGDSQGRGNLERVISDINALHIYVTRGLIKSSSELVAYHTIDIFNHRFALRSMPL